MTRPVFLVGYMACGKSTLLQAIAARIPGLRCVDLDSAVEAAAGKSIARIFAEDGEDAFRCLEADTLARLAAEADVVACGGGTPCRPGAMERMKAAGRVVWLRTDTDTTVRRLILAPGTRPKVDALLARPAELRAHVESMLAEREPFYRLADSTFDSSYLETEEQVERSARLFINTYLA